MCQRWGTPSPLAGPLFRFLSSSVVFFFPSQPGTSCRGNDNMGKTTEINNISSHLPMLSLAHFSLNVSSCEACSMSHHTSQSALLLVSSMGLRPLTHGIDTSCCLAYTQEAHTQVDLVSLLPLLFASRLFSCRKNLGCVLQLAVHKD